MTEERHSEQLGERQAERDSQLSAMFDGELPGGECELLARRLTRDDALRAQWSRYSMIGAALRAERGVALHDRVATRVQATITKEATYTEDAAAEATRDLKVAAASSTGRRGWSRFAYPLAGASIAAGVAAVSILWLRGAPDPLEGSLQASTVSPTTIVLTPEPASTASTVALNSGTPDATANADYSTPAPGSSNSIAPPARLANYVVAHSEYSGPLTRRMALLGIVGAEAGDIAEGGEAAPAEATDAP
jgi:sigma-E factor negative regulatory protein RseA